MNSSKIYIEEISKAWEIINNVNSNKIIVASNNGTGKTTTLNKINMFSKETNNYIFDFDANNITVRNQKQFYEHYYEVLMAYKIINANPLLFTNDEKLKIATYIMDNSNYIDYCWYDSDIVTIESFKTFDLTESIASKVLDSSNNSNLLLIKNFDQICASSEYVQAILERYFKLFDKVIIEADTNANNLYEEDNKDDIINSGYTFVNINQVYTLEFYKNIIKDIINIYYNNTNTNNKIPFTFDMISDDIILKLIENYNYNINQFKDIIKNFITNYEMYGYIPKDKIDYYLGTHNLNKTKKRLYLGHS